jgi:uncharacterized protein (DUF2225 family)
MIGLYAGPYPVVVELRGTCNWAAKEKDFTRQKLRQDLFMSNIARELKTSVTSSWNMLDVSDLE